MAAETRLVDLCESVVDCPHSTPVWTDGGAIVLRNQNIRAGRLDLSSPSFTDEAHFAERTRRAKPQEGDLVITREAPMGEVCMLPPKLRCCLGQRMVLLRPNRKRVEPRYLLYALQSQAVQHEILVNEGTGSTVSNLRIPLLEALPIPTPALPEQRAIAHILGTLDDKIELNRRMSETLESVARALFKSWFVDFDPVRKQAGGRDDGLPKELSSLFPDSLEDSELGSIPSGWAVADLGSFSKRIAMGPFGSDIKTDNFVDTGVPVIRGGNLTHGFVDDNFVFVSEAKADELRNANAFPGDIVITHRGTLGQVGMIPLTSRHRRYVVSQSQMLLSVNPELASPRYLFDYLRSPTGQHALLANTSQTGVPAISRPTTSLKAIRLLLPPIAILHAYERAAQAFVAREVAAATESRTLSAVRDTLLPELLSGRLNLPGALAS